jgi:glycosyltransferase involved in cell wall biosynthesis
MGRDASVSAKKKVLIIEENSSVPYDPRVWREALSLHENGYEVTVLCPREKQSKSFEVSEGVYIYRHPMPHEGSTPFGHLFEYFSALFWEILYTWWIYFRRGFHVIQGCNPPDTIFLVALPFKIFGVKYIFDHHDASPELYLSKYGKKGFLYKVLNWLEKMTYRFSDVVMATNQSYRGLAISRGKKDPNDVFVVRNGPNLATFTPRPPNPELKHGKKFMVGYVGNMNVQDGLDILVEIAAQVKSMGRDDIYFRLVGSGPGLADLRKMVHDKGLDGTVEFTGRVSDEDLLVSLSTSDVCVNPDRPCQMNDMSTMIKIMEYMALAKPIVQFESKEGRFSAQEASLYASHDNQVPNFAEKVIWLVDHPEERQKMGQFGRLRVEKELAWDYSVNNLLAAYQRALTK